jgi:hypothetical protein
VAKDEKLKREIKTLLESIQLDWAELANPLTIRERRQDIRAHMKLRLGELANLLSTLEALDAKGS